MDNALIHLFAMQNFMIPLFILLSLQYLKGREEEIWVKENVVHVNPLFSEPVKTTFNSSCH